MKKKDKEKLLRYAAFGLGGVWLLSAFGFSNKPATIENIVDQLPRRGAWPRRNRSAIDTVFVHHSSLYGYDVVSIARGHTAPSTQPGVGPYPGIAYHFVIEKDGRIWQTLELEAETAAISSPSLSRRSVSVCLVGNFETERLGSRQEESLITVLRHLVSELGPLKVDPHNAASVTECPGRNVDLATIITRV